MRLRTLGVVGAALALAAATVPRPAGAASTNATFVLLPGGSLSISVPSSTVDLGSVAAGSTSFAPQLGTVTVTDTRGALVADWVATATGTNFDLQGAGANPGGDINQRVSNLTTLYSAVPSVSSGTGVATPTAGTLAVGAIVAYVGSGSNTVSWSPTLTFTLLPTQVAGTYAGTITHSVS